MMEILRDESTALATIETPIETAVRRQTPARVFVGRSGPAYRTATQLELRLDHAAARDAVNADLVLNRDFAADFVARWRLFEVSTVATSKREYLLRPDLGRRLSDSGRKAIAAHCLIGCDLQIIVGDGLSSLAVVRQVPILLPVLSELAASRGWTIGRPFVVNHCRVGILNDVGEILRPKIAVLLIGERPGLATVESLSTYMAFKPLSEHTDANRNLISNIHARGVSLQQAAERIVALGSEMLQLQTSGVAVKEVWNPAIASSLPALGDPQV